MEPALTETTKQKSKTEPAEERYMYTSEFDFHSLDFTLPRNKPVMQRKRSLTKTISIVFLVSIIIVFYIWNKITVNRLVIEVNELKNQFQKTTSTNEMLRAEISKKSTLERIEKIAVEQLKLTYPKEQPIWFEVTTESISEH